MSNSQSLPPPETVATIRTLFFARLAEINHNLVGMLNDLTSRIDDHNHHAILCLLVDMESRIAAMRNILLVFDEYLKD